ncbi:MAG: hypothetical protein ACSHXY_06345 [Alphaproteobacteria bacterium]
MKKPLTALLFALLCAAPIAAHAQNDAREQRLENVLALTSVDAKLEGLKALLVDSTEPDEQIMLNYHIAQAYISTSHFGSAIEPLKAAVALNEKHTPDHHKRRDALSSLLQKSLLKAGRVAEGMQVSNALVEKNDALLIDMWSRNDSSIIHRTTALTCPHTIGKFDRTKSHSFDTSGRDLGCSYKIHGETENLLTVYFTDYQDEALSSSAAHASATKMMSDARSSKDAELIYAARATDVDSPAVHDVLGTLYLRSKGTQYTGTWTAVIEGWVLKTRVTWDVSLGKNFGETASKKAFALTPMHTAAQIKACKTATWPEKGEPVPDTTQMQYVMFEAMNTASERPPLECMLGSSNTGNAFIAGHMNERRLYTIAGTAIETDVFVETGHSSGGVVDLITSPEYILKSKLTASKDHKASTIILKAYKTKPSPNQVFQDFIGVYSGKVKEYGHVEYDETGGTNIVIRPMETDEDTPQNEPKE